MLGARLGGTTRLNAGRKVGLAGGEPFCKVQAGQFRVGEHQDLPRGERKEVIVR